MQPGCCTVHCMVGKTLLEFEWAEVPVLCYYKRRSAHLATTKDVLKHHMKRGLHQLCLYKRAAKPESVLPDPTLFGRTLTDDGCLLAKRMTQPAIPKIIKIFCKWKRCGSNYSCKGTGTECNTGCVCSGDPQECGRFTITDDWYVNWSVSHMWIISDELCVLVDNGQN
jgi:hypothetical protein